MKDLNYQLSKLCRDNRDGSFSTQATRSRILDLIASQLPGLGFRRMQPRSLKPKHIDALVAHWQEQGIGIGTLKNRLSALRWWAKKVNKPSIIAKDNDVYGIGKRDNVARKSKTLQIDEKKLSAISDQHVRLSIRLQAAFGLRREESIKFSPSYAVQDDHIKLKPSWTVQQLNRYQRQLRNAGMSRLHGLRHAYAQQRYLALTGWLAPVAGGPTSKQLTPEQRGPDYDARIIVSHELGHARVEIAVVYLGR